MVPEECYWSGLDKAPSGTREYFRDAFTDIEVDSSFTQLPLKVAYIAEEQLRLAERGYDVYVVRVEP